MIAVDGIDWVPLSGDMNHIALIGIEGHFSSTWCASSYQRIVLNRSQSSAKRRDMDLSVDGRSMI